MAETTSTDIDTDPFSDPATGSGLDPFLNLVVIIKPQSTAMKPSKHGNGNVLTVSAEVIAVTGDDPGFSTSTVIYSGSLVPQIKGQIGKLVIGVLTRKDFGKGLPGWDLLAATPEQRKLGVKVLAMLAEKEKSMDPFS